MRKVKNRYIRWLVLLLIIQGSCLPTYSYSQTNEEVYYYALEVMNEGNYSYATSLLQRVRYFDSENKFLDVFRLLGDCYYADSEYDNAYYYYDLARIQANSDSAAAGFQLMKAACKLYSQNYHEALVDLLSVDQPINPEQYRMKELLSGLTYFYIGDHAMAKQSFTNCFDSTNLIKRDSIDYYFIRISKIATRYNPRTARVLSIILPGAGQFYSGDYKNGLNSFLLTAGLIGAGSLMMGSVSVFDAAIIVLPWFQRYYTGGFQKVYHIAEKTKIKKQNEELLKVVRLLVIDDTQADLL